MAKSLQLVYSVDVSAAFVSDLTARTRLIAREHPRLLVNACSPGFCRTDIAGADVDYSKGRPPKDARLGADVVLKLLFGEVGAGSTGGFYKECSKPGTPIDAANSAAEPWVAK